LDVERHLPSFELIERLGKFEGRTATTYLVAAAAFHHPFVRSKGVLRVRLVPYAAFQGWR
jgi:hypothetical protein